MAKKDEQNPAPEGDEQEGDEAPEAPPAPAPNLSLSADAIRNSPEFKTLERQNRSLARKAGAAESAAATARADAETARQAAEAQQQAAFEAQIAETLGPEGVAAWQEISDLSATDQLAAARRLAELMAGGKAQSQPEGEPPEQPPAEEAPVAPAATPPPPTGGVDGSQALGAATTAEDMDAVIAGLEKGYYDVVKRNQDPVTRNRVTMRDRAAGFINFLGAAYLKAGATPKQK